MIINLAVLQPTNLCNLNCSYCYLPGRKDPGLMSDEVLEASIKCILDSSMVQPITDKDELTVVWHSGEPLIAGVEFYEKAVELFNKNNLNNINIRMDLQTNATLINDKWCDFFTKSHFNVGVSIDGPQFIHDAHRKNWAGKGSYNLVMKGINKLRDKGLPLRAICVLTKKSLDYPEEIYSFFKAEGFSAICFNVEESECLNERSTLLAVGDDDNPQSIINKYRYFMSTVYDLWDNDNRKIEIREFDRMIKLIKLKQLYPGYYFPNTETLAFGIVAITKTGEISTFSPEMAGGVLNDPHRFSIGNVLQINRLDDILSNANFKNQLAAIKTGVENCLKECKYFDLCGGGSPSNKFYENGSFESTETAVCKLAKKTMLDLMLDKLKKLKH